jgi:hypothetical protein
MRTLKTLLTAAALLAGLAMASAAQAQVYVGIGVQPVCSYGYYGYAPYACAPMGFYGPGYFYNGIFLGMGPWGGWGYSHGWGGHRFSGEGGGSYHGGPGRASYRGDNGAAQRGGTQFHNNARPANGSGARPNAARSAPQGAASHGGGGHEGGGGGEHR